MKCPACGDFPKEIEIRAGLDVQFCQGCSGLWFVKGQLARYCRTGSDLPNLPKSKQSAQTGHLDCPACPTTKLSRMLFSSEDSLMVDVCPSCEGLWLDKGELKHVYELARYSEAAKKLQPASEAFAGANVIRFPARGSKRAPSPSESGVEGALALAPIPFPTRQEGEGGLKFFAEQDHLTIEQHHELTELLVNWETSNCYTVFGDGRRRIGSILEKTGALALSLAAESSAGTAL